MTSKPIEDLLAGHATFEETIYIKDRAKFEKLASLGQSPKTLLISCSDSRVDPMQIFQMEPGDLFVVRNVGAIVPPYQPDGSCHGTSAAIEFAVKALNVEAIAILGHSNCGAVEYCHKRVNDPQNENAPDFEFIPQWVDFAGQAEEAPEPDVHAFGKRMLGRSLTNLEAFPFVRERVQAGKLALVALRFNIHNGKLEHISQRG
ncbi:MAG: carbonic anhydrase [Alphaproteobacteria bacterium]